MRIKIPKNQLLRQLPSVIAAQLASCNDLPDYFDFQIFDVKHDNEKNEEQKKEDGASYKKFVAEYPLVANALSPMEFHMFCVMIKNTDGARLSQLATKLKHPDFNTANNVAVHIKGMRLAFGLHKLPYEVSTTRGSVITPVIYKLVKRDV